MNDKANNQDDFEAPGSEEIEITIRGKTGKFIVHDISGEDVTQVFAPLQTTDPAKKTRAQRELKARIIAAMVWRADGSTITFEEASKFRVVLQNKLEEAALKFNGLVPEAEADAKNE